MGRHLTSATILFLVFLLNIASVYSKAVIWRAYTANSYFCSISPDSVYISYVYANGVSCTYASYASTCTLSAQGYDSYIERCVDVSDFLSPNDPSLLPPWSGEFIEVRGITSPFTNCSSSLITSNNPVKGYYKNNICVLGYFSTTYKSRVTVTSTFAELYESCQINVCTSGCTGNSPNRALPSTVSNSLYCSPTFSISPVIYRTVNGENYIPASPANTLLIIISSSVIGTTVCILCCCVLCCICILSCCCVLLKKSANPNKNLNNRTTTTVITHPNAANQYVPPTIQNTIQQPQQSNYYYANMNMQQLPQQQQQQQLQLQQNQYYSQAYYAATPQPQQQPQAYPTELYSTNDNNAMYSYAYANPTDMMQFSTANQPQHTAQMEMNQPLMQQMHTPQHAEETEFVEHSHPTDL